MGEGQKGEAEDREWGIARSGAPEGRQHHSLGRKPRVCVVPNDRALKGLKSRQRDTFERRLLFRPFRAQVLRGRLTRGLRPGLWCYRPVGAPDGATPDFPLPFHPLSHSVPRPIRVFAGYRSDTGVRRMVVWG